MLKMEKCNYWSQVSVSSLLSLSVESLMKCLPNYMDDVFILPSNLKEKIIKLMSKRGLITDENIAKVLPNTLRELDLSECDVSDDGLKTINKCPNLRKIDINSAKASRPDVTSIGVMHIACCCPMLEVVYLRRCINLSDEGIEVLASHCPRLRELNIGGNELLGDRTLSALGKNCRHLSCLNISKANVTDDGIFSLVMGYESNSLKELHINGCKNLTDEAVDAVIQRCPKMNILLFHGCPHITERSRMALEEMVANSNVRQVTWTIY